MTVFEWINKATKSFEGASLSTTDLDAEILLANELDKDRSWLHTHLDYEIEDDKLAVLNKSIARRAKHEPIAYIIGKKEFYRRDFFVSPDTLTPRPETETMIELLLEYISNLKPQTSNLNIIDVGTGSGCIIITAALELASILNSQSSTSYIGLDISKKALNIARKNAKNLKANVEFEEFNLLTGDLSPIFTFSKIQDPISVIFLANLPYVPDDFNINLSANHEPKFAIYGGKDGLDYYKALFSQISTPTSTKYHTPTTIYTESLPPQHAELTKIANESGYELIKTQDFIQVFST